MQIKDIRFLFLKLSIWLCLASSLTVAVSALALSIPLSAVGTGLLLPPLLFYFIYVEDRRGVSPEDEINQPRRTALVRRYQTELLATELLALLGYEALLAWSVLAEPTLGLAHLLLGQLPFLVLGAYGRLKRHPTFDSLAVGATWAFVIVFSLDVATAQVTARELGEVFLGWFLIAAAGVESRNLQDAEGDVRSGRGTLAALLGRRTTTALVGLTKFVGVVVFWRISGVVAAGLTVGYLLVLRLFRALTRRESFRVAG